MSFDSDFVSSPIGEESNRSYIVPAEPTSANLKKVTGSDSPRILTPYHLASEKPPKDGRPRNLHVTGAFDLEWFLMFLEALTAKGFAANSHPTQFITAQGVDFITGQTTILEHPDLGLGKLPTWDTHTVWASMTKGVTAEIWDEKLGARSKATRGKRNAMPKINLDVWMFFSEGDLVGAHADPLSKVGTWFTSRLHRSKGMVELQAVPFNSRKARNAHRKDTGEAIGSGAEQWQARYVPTPLVWVIEGQSYQLCVNVLDAAKFNPSGFAALCEGLGIETPAKGSMDEFKACMIEPYQNDFENYCAYGLGDVAPFPEIVKRHYLSKQAVWKIGAAEDTVLEPPGKMVETECGHTLYYPPLGNSSLNLKMLESHAMRGFNPDKPFPWDLLSYSDANDKTKALKAREFLNMGGFSAIKSAHSQDTMLVKLAMSSGGYAKNMRPGKGFFEGPIVDTDGSSFYVTIMGKWMFIPVGIPVMWAAPTQDDRHKISLGKVFGDNPEMLEHRAWKIILSSSAALEFHQTLIQSKIIKGGNLALIGTDGGSDEDVNSDVRLFLQEIRNGELTLDTWQAACMALSRSERRRMLDCLEVQAYLLYPLAEEVKDLGELQDAYLNRGECEVEQLPDGKGYKSERFKPCHAWFRVPLAPTVNGISSERGVWKAKLSDAKKALKAAVEEVGGMLENLPTENRLALESEVREMNARQEGFKLQGNSVFGTLCSSILAWGNAVTASNITGAGRAWAWAQSVSLHMMGIVTDGGSFQINNVAFPGSNTLTMDVAAQISNYSNLTKDQKKQIRFGGLAGKSWELRPVMGEVEKDGVKVQAITGAQLWADGELFETKTKDGKWPLLSQAIHEHTLMFWAATGRPIADVVRHIGHEVKDCFKDCVWQGQANYRFTKIDGKPSVKARGHKVQQDSPRYSESSAWGQPDQFSAMERMLEDISKGPKIGHQKPQAMIGPLMSTQWHDNPSKYLSRGVLPGGSWPRTSWVRPLSMSQFHWQNDAQYEAWVGKHERLKKERGYGLELFYMDDEGLIDYEGMVKDIHERVMAGEGPTEAQLTKSLTHPYLEQHHALKDSIEL